MEQQVERIHPRPARYRCGDVEVDAQRHLVLHRGESVAVEPRVFAVLLVLLGRAGAIVTRDELLDAVWGHRYVTPSTLSRVIALARRAFGDDAQSPRYILTVHGTGYRYAGPLERFDGPDAGVARFAPPPGLRLPARLDPILGREAELTELAHLYAEARAVTLVGPGGVGKTQCALECARRLEQGLVDGVWCFDLVEIASADDWLGALADALGVPAADRAQALERIAAALADRALLLVLDNCEHIAPVLGEYVHALLVATRQLRVLATSQRALQFLGERLYRLGPLALPVLPEPPAAPDVAALVAAPAMALLLARIRAVQPGFVAGPANVVALAEICLRLDGMPLALELAAARFALLSPQQVLERLDQRFRFLASSAAGRDPRHRNLEALLEWGHGLLSPAEQRLLAWLGVFVRGWTAETLIAMGAVLGHDAATSVDLLGGLVDKSLVSVDALRVPPRYRLLESVREFALARLAQAGETDLARDAHVAALGALAARLVADGHRGLLAAQIEALGDELGNIDAAITHATPRDPEAALGLVGALLFSIKWRGAAAASLPMCLRAVAGTPATPTRARARALLTLGVTGLPFSQLNAGEVLEEAVAASMAAGDAWVEAYARAHLALRLADHGDTPAARRAMEAALAVAATLGDAVLDGLVALARGWVLLAEGRPDEAIAAMWPARRLGADVHQHHFIEMYLGLAEFRRDRPAAAARHFGQATTLALQIGNVRGAAGGMEGCAYLEARAGHALEAARLLGAAEAIRARTIPLYRWWLGHHDEAVATVEAALGVEAAAAERQAGARLRAEDAITLALATLSRHAAAAE